MQIRRTILSVALLAVPLAILPGCTGATPSPTTIISGIETGVVDATAAVDIAKGAADAYFAGHPDPAVQAKVDMAADDALRGVTDALNGATSLADANVQTALQAFSAAYSELMQLLATIGVQTGTVTTLTSARVKAGMKAGDVVTVRPPRILQFIKAPAPVAPTGGGGEKAWGGDRFTSRRPCLSRCRVSSLETSGRAGRASGQAWPLKRTAIPTGDPATQKNDARSRRGGRRFRAGV